VRRSLPQGTLPPIEASSSSQNKFGATGAVRLFSRLPTPRTEAYLASLDGGGNGNAGNGNGYARGSGGTSSDFNNISDSESGGENDGAAEDAAVREPRVPKLPISFAVDPSRSLQEMREQDRI
jgi:hypothetical protein